MIYDSDILYLYDAKLTNPNGDPDEENKPRMDEASGRNLVSDVRLKRYLRDYWLNSGKDIWVRRTEKSTDAKGRMKVLLEEYNSASGRSVTEKAARGDQGFIDWLLDKLIDVRLFGATMPMEQTSLTFTGPAQFGWGYSLHRVEINSSATISSTFAGRETAGEYGTFGKDWRVYYSLIGFHGIISRNRARHTRLTEDDIAALDDAMLKAIPNEATSRSKMGQVPRLYLRIAYADGTNAKLGDLREDVVVVPVAGKTKDTLRDVRDYNLDVTRLLERMRAREKEIRQVYLFQHPDLSTTLQQDLKSIFGERLVAL
jgi:CRISPR-associated protein Csh2